MLPEQKAYIYAWVDGVTADGFRAGIYCSGISAAKEGGEDIVTADDIRQNAGARKIVFWVTNDACPPSPGCAFPKPGPSPARQLVFLSPKFGSLPSRRSGQRLPASCPANYSRDGNCYPPGIDIGERLHIDVNTATSADPSQGRNQ